MIFFIRRDGAESSPRLSYYSQVYRIRPGESEAFSCENQSIHGTGSEIDVHLNIHQKTPRNYVSCLRPLSFGFRKNNFPWTGETRKKLPIRQVPAGRKGVNPAISCLRLNELREREKRRRKETLKPGISNSSRTQSPISVDNSTLSPCEAVFVIPHPCCMILAA